jgi:hypothetical protein
VQEAAIRLVTLLQEIDSAVITVVTEDMGQLSHAATAGQRHEFAEINDSNDCWEIV